MTRPAKRLTERQRFERWAKSEGFRVEQHKFTDVYRSVDTESAWLAWKASARVRRPARKSTGGR